jgi:hypothetical protein
MTEIILSKDTAILRAIYYRDRQDKYFFGPATKKQSIYLTITLLAFPFFTLKALSLEDSTLLVMGSIFFSLICYDFWRAAKPIISWRRSVEAFLKKAETIKDLRFMYNDIFFIHIQDQEELKQHWEVVDKAIINDQFIWLYSDSNVLLPKGSMTDVEYQDLKNMVMDKVKNVEKEGRL